jgi:hypothetical protein
MNTYTTRYERFKGKGKKGASSRAGHKVSKRTEAEKVPDVPPSTKAVNAEIPVSKPANPPPVDIPVADNFVDLRDDGEEEEEGPAVFKRKQKTVEDDVGEDPLG